MMLAPVGERVLAASPPVEDRRVSGLIIPDHYDRVKMAIVMKCGDGLGLSALGLVPGDMIYYLEGSESKIKDLLILEASYIIAIERDDDGN